MDISNGTREWNCLAGLAFGTSEFQSRGAPQQESSMCSVYHNGRSQRTLQSAGFMGVPNPIRGAGAGTQLGQIGVSPGVGVMQPSGQNESQPKKRGPKAGAEKGCQNCRFNLWLNTTWLHPKELKEPKVAKHKCPQRSGYYVRQLGWER